MIGSGPIDLVFVMGWVSHLEYFWNEPSFARFLTRLSSRARLILFDKRGTGLSDPVPVSELPSLDTRLDDVRAVMEAVGSRRAVLMGVSEGGPLCSLFAATYPEKTEALIMIGSYARRMWDHDYPWGPTLEDRDRFCQTIIDEWGGPVGLEERAPSVAGDRGVQRLVVGIPADGREPGRRRGADAHERRDRHPRRAAVDPRARPSWCIAPATDVCEWRRAATSHRGFREPPSSSCRASITCRLSAIRMRCCMWSKTSCPVAIVARRRPSSLATVIAVAARGSASELDLIRRIFDRECQFFRGRSLSSAANPLAASFDGPGRAVQCALSVVGIARQSRIDASAGVHIGAFDAAQADEPVSDAAAAIAAAATEHEVHASRTVVDLLAGSGFTFGERGPIMAAADRPLAVLSVHQSDRTDA